MEGDAKLQEAGCIHFFKRSFKGSSHDDAPAPKVGAQKYQQDVTKQPFYQPAFSTTGWSEDQETRVEPRVELRIEPRVSLL